MKMMRMPNWLGCSSKGRTTVQKIATIVIHIKLSCRSNEQQEEAIRLLEHLQFIHTTAKEAVALGDGTLKEANNTYHILAGFQNQVQQSSESAKLALQTVPGIEQQIRDAQKTVEEAESVSVKLVNDSTSN